MIEEHKRLDELKKNEELKRKQMQKNMIINVNEEENNQKQIFICEEDDLKFYSEKQYLKHYEEQHPNLYPFYCDKCEKGFNSLNALLAHKNDSFKHRQQNFETYFYCKVCNRRFKSKLALNAHLKDKNHFHRFQCSICDKIFTSEMALNNHCKDKAHFSEE